VNRKRIFVFFAVFCTMVLVGCDQEHYAENDIKLIGPTTLTYDQRDLLALLSVLGYEVFLFDFSVHNTEYNNMQVWVEVYHHGVLFYRTPTFHIVLEGDNRADGQLAFVIDHDFTTNMYSWLFAIDGGTSGRHDSGFIVSEAELVRMLGPMPGPVYVSDNADFEDIVLHVSLFSDKAVATVGRDFQRFFTDFSLLSDFPYAHIVKARFF